MKSSLTKTAAVLCLTAAFAWSLIVQAQRPPARAALADLAWLTGNWSGRNGASELEERWTKPAGGAMLAVSRTIKDSKMVGFEFLRIVERDGGLVYIAQPGGRPPTDFVATEVASRRVSFENPSHDFPKRIEYKLSGDSLTATISGGGQRESYVFKRAE
jgi:hypothetical protein